MIAKSLDEFLRHSKWLRSQYRDDPLALFCSDCEEIVGKLRRTIELANNYKARAEYAERELARLKSGKPQAADLASAPPIREKPGKASYLWPVIIVLALAGVLALYLAAGVGW